MTARIFSDRGASAIELAVLAPALMMLCLIIVQFGLWFNARQVALGAAQAGATVAREEAGGKPAWRADAEVAARRDYTSLHTTLLRGFTPAAWRHARGDSVGVTVHGTGISVFPFFHITLGVTASAGGPIECFHPAGLGERC